MQISNRFDSNRFFLFVMLLTWLGLAGCSLLATPAPQTATVRVTFDIGGGGTGFAASVYAQEVDSGNTYSLPYAAGSHGGVVLPSSPITFTVAAPGTYVFYANLVNAPESYHYGATGCMPASNCPSSALKALDVLPGGIYQVIISDRSAPVPTPHAPLTVPWTR
jgi:hypothetical protein